MEQIVGVKKYECYSKMVINFYFHIPHFNMYREFRLFYQKYFTWLGKKIVFLILFNDVHYFYTLFLDVFSFAHILFVFFGFIDNKKLILYFNKRSFFTCLRKTRVVANDIQDSIKPFRMVLIFSTFCKISSFLSGINLEASSNSIIASSWNPSSAKALPLLEKYNS